VNVFDELRGVVESGDRAVVLTVLAGESIGAKLLVRESGEAVGDAPAGLAELGPAAIRRGRSHMLEHDGLTLFADVYGPPPRLFVYGAVDTAEALCAAARLLGWHTIVADARQRFATAERVPSADELLVEWPDEALERVQPDIGTAIFVLTHDDKFDIPLLTAAVRTDAFYIGALGSRRNQERRREVLRDEGLSDEELCSRQKIKSQLQRQSRST
jgi:xanthine dehydrogenase accessory factor